MRISANSISFLLAAALLLALASPCYGQVEKRPAEQAAENLYNKGIGSAWVSGDPFASSDQMRDTASPLFDYRIIGFLNVTSGIIVAADGSSSMLFAPGAGSYPVYGYFENDRMMGVFIDFNSSLVKI